MFWLSHHHPEEYNRTYLLGGVRVCARCLGTYPVLFAAIWVQAKLKVPLEWRWDGLWALLLPLPALVDWSLGRFRPASSSNLIRTVTGVLLGLGLARTLFIHFQRPLPVWLVAQLGLVTAVALPVILIAGRKRGG